MLTNPAFQGGMGGSQAALSRGSILGGNLRNASLENDEKKVFAPSKERFHAYLSGSYVFRGLFCS